MNVSVLTLSCVDSIHRLRETVSTEHTTLKQKELETMPNASHGYGGKFGVQNDRMDKVRGSEAQDPPNPPPQFYKLLPGSVCARPAWSAVTVCI